jgi:cytochrome P450
MTTSDQLLQLPFSRDSILDLAPAVRELLKTRPIARVRTVVGDEAWFVTGYHLVKELLEDERLGRAHPDPDNAPRISGFYLNGGPIGDFDTEQADHLRFRKLMAPAFSPRRMNQFEHRIQDIVNELLDGMQRQERPVDLHTSFSAPLPIFVICELMGVPVADRDKFTRWVRALDTVSDAEGSAAAYGELAEYMRHMVERRREDPGEDVISDLATSEMSHEEAVYFAAGLLFAGYAAPTATINFGTVLLSLAPDQKERILADPTLIPSAVEEISRLVPLGSRFGMLRYAKTDLRAGEVLIRAGEAVLLMTTAANRDPAVFTRPDHLDVARDPNPHLARGAGARYCLGASLSRAQLGVAFAGLYGRFPGLRLAVPVTDLELSTDQIAERLVRVPVTW